MQKPTVVNRAILLLYVTLVIGCARTFLESIWPRLSGNSHDTMANALSDFFGPALVTFLVGFAILAWLIYKIDQARNWARITLAVLFVVGTLFSFPALKLSFERSVASGSLGVLQVVLQAIALCMLFGTGANRWFRSGQGGKEWPESSLDSSPEDS